MPGELYIGGDGVTRGYWQRADLTAERFPPDPFVKPERAAPAGARMYRTGDLALRNVGGDYYCLGRIDNQVKVMGYRVELEEIDAHEIPTLLVMNKIDMLDDFEPRIDRDEENKPIRVWLSAQTGIGVPLLFQALTERLSGEVAQHTLRLPPQEGRLRSRFYQLQAIEKEWMEDDGSVGMQVRMPIVDWRRLCKQEPALVDYIV